MSVFSLTPQYLLINFNPTSLSASICFGLALGYYHQTFKSSGYTLTPDLNLFELKQEFSFGLRRLNFNSLNQKN